MFGNIPKQEIVSKLVRIYANMERWIQNNIYSITVDNYTERKAQKALKELKLTMRVFNEQVDDYFELNIPKVYNDARVRTGSKIEKKFKKDKVRSLNNEAITDRMIKRNRRTFLKANASIPPQARIYLRLIRIAQSGLLKLQEFEEDEFKAKIRDVIEEGLRVRTLTTKKGFQFQGTLSRGQVTKQIENLFTSEFGDIAFIRINDRNYRFKPYADMLAKTEMRNAQSNGVISAGKEYDSDLVIFSTHFMRHDDECTPLQGQVFSISGKSPIYPQLTAAETPAVHPRCQHNIDPWDEILGVA